VRLLAGEPVDESTWNRGITALEKLYDWALEREYITKVPFTYRDGTKTIPGEARRSASRGNTAIASGGEEEEIKCVSLDEYLLFRDVGLKGLDLSGNPDPSFRGRNGLRNAGFADFLVSTGVRLQEGASILLAELPDPRAPIWNDFVSCKMRLGKLTTKGQKGRAIWIPKHILRDSVLAYVEEARDNALAKAEQSSLYANVNDIIRIKRFDKKGAVLASNSKLWSYDKIKPDDRFKMYEVDGDSVIQPASLWLSEQGMPTVGPNFTAIFARACDRLRRRFDIHLEITPHTLRHTFAVYMLTHLVRGTLGTITGLKGEKETLGLRIYRSVIADPLRTLQRLLGHSSILSTYIYLTYLEETGKLIDDAIGS
jgi:site-specific recombinase XerD